MMQSKKEIPQFPVEPVPMRPVMEKKVRPHRQTTFIKKKFPIVDHSAL